MKKSLLFPGIIASVFILSLVLASCGGGDSSSVAVVAPPASGGGGTGYFIVSGSVVVPDPAYSKAVVLDAKRAHLGKIEAASLVTGPLSGGHVSLCTTTATGSMGIVPGVPPVIAGATGNFVLSINRITAAGYGDLFVCVEDAANGINYYAPVPLEYLPTADNEVTSVSVNVNTASTVLTRYFCNDSLYFTADRCTFAQSTIVSFQQTFQDFVDAWPSIGFSSGNWSSFFDDITYLSDGITPTPICSWLESYTTTNGFYTSCPTFVSAATGFSDPVIPSSCGNGTCEAGYGETSITCPYDCGGGGGGGGGASVSYWEEVIYVVDNCYACSIHITVENAPAGAGVTASSSWGQTVNTTAGSDGSVTFTLPTAQHCPCLAGSFTVSVNGVQVYSDSSDCY